MEAKSMVSQPAEGDQTESDCMKSLTCSSSSSHTTSSSSRATLQEVLVKEYNIQLSAPPPPTLPRKYSSPYANKLGRCRPLSAPASTHRPSKPSEELPVYLRQPQRIRVTAYKNGSTMTFTKVTASNIAMLLEDCTVKLRLNSAARRIFLADGAEAHAPEDIPQDAAIYISTGEAFVDPLAEIRAHLSVCRERSWTLEGLVQSGADHGRGGTRATRLSCSALARLCQGVPGAQRVLIFRNGTGRDGYEVSTTMQSLEQFLDVCTEKLHLTASAKMVYNWNGKAVEDLNLVPRLDGCLRGSGAPSRGPLWASRGEALSVAGVQTYVRETVKALRQRLTAGRQHLKQLEWAEAGRLENVTAKEILSLTGKEWAKAKEKAQTQIKELEGCLRKHQQQLSILGRMAEVDSSRPSGSTWPLSQGPPLPQGLQLKVHQPGRDSGHTLVFVNRVELQKGCERDEERMMNRLLQIIHRRLGAGAVGCPSGLRLSPAWVYDERGEAVRSPLHLQNGQRVWVSYGEDHRLCGGAVLALSLEKAVAAVEVDRHAVHRTPLDPEVALPVGHQKYHVSEEFPQNCTASTSQCPPSKACLNSYNHYLQLKEDPSVVLIPSIRVGNGPKTGGAEGNLVWPLAHVWSIRKAGEIVSCAFPQLCLAASPTPITLRDGDGEETQAHTLLLQKRKRDCPFQQWRFGGKGHVYCEALSELALTYLQEGRGCAEVTPQPKGQLERPQGREGADGSADPEPSEAAPSDSPWGNAASQGAQLSVALLRQHKDKQAQASAQRWAIRPERIQRKERGNLQRSHQGYAWPVLPTGEINEGVILPLEGALVPCTLPFPLSGTRGSQSFTPLRLVVLRIGQCGDRTMATSVTLPNITNSRMRSQMAKSRGSCEGNTEDQNIEFQEFLNRCTERLNLPSAAQRLFDEHGKEAFLLTGLQRDQLVYVSCGEQWVSPQHRQSDALRRLTVFRLEQDVARIRHYCALRSLHDLVLDVEGHPQEGSALLVRPYCVEPEDITSEESQGPPDPKARCDLSNACLGDAHSRAHQRADEQTTKHQYPWQQSSKASSDVEDECTNGDNSVKKDKSRPGAHRQQFEWTEGQLVSCRSPWLAVGVRASEGGSADHTGSPIQLMPRNPSDPQQLWICREGERTLHLQADPSLVLSVSMPQITHVQRPATTPTGWPLTLQKHKPHSPAVAHQRWHWLPEQRVLCAFYTDMLELELTAACLASVCTACVCPQPLQQQGYYVCSPREKQRTEVCVSCATELRGKVHLKRLPVDSTFRCATANQNPQLNLRGPFRNLSVCETDLSTEAAGVTLRRLEERLEHLRREGSGQTQSPGAGSSGSTQPPVKVLAHRNGQSREEAQLITAATMPLLLAEGTRRLGLQRAVKHLYTTDGTRILTMQQLKAWALNQSLREHHPLKDTDTRPDIHMTDATISGEPGVEDELDPAVAQALPLVTEADVDTVDQALLALVLREPVPVWMSCGEPFRPPDVVKQIERQRAARWMKKGKLCVDLEIRRHKLRQQKARLPPSQDSSSLISQTIQRASETTAELNSSETRISVEESVLERECKEDLLKEGSLSATHDLYHQPKVKRVLVHCNGGDITQPMYVWGRSIDELLHGSTERLGLLRPASVLYSAVGEPVTSWAQIQRDTLLCVSAGEPFLTPKDCRDRIEMKASFARAMRHHRHTASSMAVELEE